jgi:diguanylate cyclase (GGDEF)-like protein/PAS domain S-box-containing protein
MRLQIALSFLLVSIVTTLMINFLENSKDETINTLINQQLATSKATYNAVIDTYTIAAIKDFNSLMKNKKALNLLKQFKYADAQEQNIIRGKLYRLLYKDYAQMKKLYIRQFHFHTYDGKSLLRFHLPYESGDSLMKLRTSIRVANTQFKKVTGYEGGRIYPGYRYVFPIIYDKDHLGSVEFSISFEGIEKKLHELLPYNSYQQIMTKESSVDKVFPWHRRFVTPSPFSPNYYVENSELSKITHKSKSDPLMQKLISLAKSTKDLKEKLKQHRDFSLYFIDDDKSYTITFISYRDTDGKHAGYIVTYTNLNEILTISKKYDQYDFFILLSALFLFILIVIIIKQYEKARIFKEKIIATNQSLSEAQAIAHFGSWEIDLIHDKLFWSDEVYKIFKLDKKIDKLTNDIFLSFVHPDDREKLMKIYKESLKNRTKYSIRHRIITKDGEIRHIEEHAYHKYSHSGEPIKSIGTVYDVTDQVEAYLRLEKFVDLQRSIVILTDGYLFQFANRSFFDFFGYEDLESFKEDYDCICELFMKKDGFFSLDDVKGDETNWIESLLNLSERKRIVSMLDNTNTPHAFAVAINTYDDQHYVIDFSDISDTMLEKLQLENQVNHDQLTDTFNRVFFETSIHDIIRTHKNKELLTSIIFFDIDHFKDINDTYGHEVGDKVLIELTTLVKGMIRSSDYLIRWGGEEFIIISSAVDITDSVTMAENIRKAIEKIKVNDTETLTCSFGIALHKTDEKIKTTIARADEKLYEAKNSGRNKVIY